jgi:hypothetical protein
MMISILWDIRAYSPLKADQRLGRTCRFHHQGQVRNQHEAGNKTDSPKRWLAFNGLHALTLQNSKCLILNFRRGLTPRLTISRSVNFNSKLDFSQFLYGLVYRISSVLKVQIQNFDI